MLRIALFVVVLLFASIPTAHAQARLIIGGAGVVQLGGGNAETHMMFSANNGGQGGGPETQRINRVQAVIAYGTATAVDVVSGANRCSIDNALRRLTIDAAAPAGEELPTQTLCVVRWSWSGMVLFADIVEFRAFRNVLGNVVPGQITLGALAEQNSPTSTPPALAYAPDHNSQVAPDGAIEIVFPAAPIGTLTRREIQITAIGGTGGLGSATVSTCAAYRYAGTGIVAYIPNVQQYNFGAGANATVPFRVECSTQESAQRALVVCLESTNPGNLRQRAWDVTCAAAGTPPDDLLFASGFEP